MFRLESDVKSQNDLDYAYNEFSTLLKQEMTQKLECKTVKVHFSGTNNKRRKISKPWWNSDLTKAWNELCTLEKGWQICKITPRKAQLKRIFIAERKCFDHMVQKAKRAYYYKIQTDILNEAHHDNNEFWKSIGKVGIGSKKISPWKLFWIMALFHIIKTMCWKNGNRVLVGCTTLLKSLLI